MPNRMIKESIRTSRNVNSLSDFEFRVWLYLITYVDDYGRGSADTELLRCFVFPRRKNITESQIGVALNKLASLGMVNLYEVDGEPYFCFPKWANHQRIQTKRSKFPDPPSSTVTHGDSPSETKPNQIETETKIEPEIETETEANAREAAFDKFWSAYPKKVGKQDAKKAFKSVKEPIETLLSAIERQKCGSQWSKDNGQYIPHPATWLRQGRWEDEEYKPITSSTSSRMIAKKPEEYQGRDFWDD